MSEQFPFIGRESELSRIKKYIEELGETRIIFIHGEGGIGKTRLLQEIYAEYRHQKDIRVTDIFDFDDQKFLSPENMSRKIADIIDQETFEPFLTAQIDYYKMQAAGVSHEKLKEESLNLNRKFTDCLNIVSKLKRFILFFDTTDHLEEEKGVWQDIEEKIPHLKNVVLLIAGRNAKSLGESLRKKHFDNVEIIDLKPLSAEDSQLYLQKKQEQKSITVEPDLAEKLLLFSDGRPILIDLAVEWRTRGISLEWIQLSDEEQREHFEKYIVSHIKDIRRPMDQLALLMSCIYPLNAEMISELLKEEDASKLFEEALTYVFVKQLPNGYLSLHDEMRRMVNKYIWPEVDPAYVRRRWYSERILKYISGEIKTHTNNIQNYKEELKQIEKKYPEKTLELSLKIQEAEQHLLELRQQQVTHTLLTDIDEGIKIFAKAFDDAKTHYPFREILLNQIEQYIDRLSTEQQYELNTRKVKYLLYKGEYLQGKEIVEDILKWNISPELRVDMLTQIGNIEMRIGNYKSGIFHFKEAVQISEDNKFEESDESKPYLMRARHALGWGYRMIGNYDKAIEEYQAAHELSIILYDKTEEAWILNDLAVAYSHDGKITTALNYAIQARELWQELDEKEGLGAFYHVYSEINTKLHKWNDVISFSEKALDIFKASGNFDWLYRIYILLGNCYLRRSDINVIEGDISTVDQDLKRAETYILKAIDSKGMHKMEAQHYIGHIYLTKDRIQPGKYIDKAQDYYQTAYDNSKDAFLNVIQLNCLGDLAYIALQKKDYNRFEYLMKQYNEYRKIWSDEGIPQHFEGLLLKYFGDFILETKPSETDKAIDYYLKGLPLLVSRDYFPPYNMIHQLKDIENRLKRLPGGKAIKIDLSSKLYELWNKDPKLSLLHPEVRSFFIRWQKGESRNGSI
ncbi:MAG: ATP-binding protein [Desulfobacteraceae bacterium]|nr:ATP-binding protein [Desulfobacteraceae bacterium]